MDTLDKPAATTRLQRLARVAREPLVHFLIFGALIFAADYALVAVRGNPSDIVVPKEVYQEASETFVAGMKRQPTPAEMKILIDRWIDNEVLYREGLALGLDKGDPAMRDRVIFKTLSLAQAGLVLPKIDESGLRMWFDSRRDRYNIPARFDFEEAVISGGDSTTEKLQKFAASLNARQAPDGEGSLRIFKDRPRPNLVQSYGTNFTAAIEKQVPGQWTVAVSNDGPRVVRLVATTPGQAIDFNDVKERVYKEWKESTSTELSKNAIREIAKKYRIREERKVS
ncbi:MAG: peptidyl-prolyl cis-trans isomerase [Herminiimonas sp.]|nr:peptidyl-prolyl cis-trans isomerase [Herminiimonas sp.]